jgi:cytochrome c oxidase assembly protein subunit 15
MAVDADYASALPDRDRLLRNRAQVRFWLYSILVVLFALILVGGATRMTGSGLSITE